MLTKGFFAMPRLGLFSTGYDKFKLVSEAGAASAALWLTLVRLNLGLSATAERAADRST